MAKQILANILIIFFLFSSTAMAADIVNLKEGDPAPFEGVLLSKEAAAQIIIDKKFEDQECDLKVEYALEIQSERYELQLQTKDISLQAANDRYEQMMILKTTEVENLREIALKPKPADGPWLVALGFGIGTLTSLGVFALSTEIVSQ
tara:strand:- start:8246 stop:8689 length:444 start_codon:yes stop_codon:yes gene_type:complete